jgi:hypothetical protein
MDQTKTEKPVDPILEELRQREREVWKRKETEEKEIKTLVVPMFPEGGEE